MYSLFEEDDHVIVDVHANIAVRFVLYGEAATQQAQAMPCFSIFAVEFSFDVFSNVRVVTRAKSFQCFDGAHDAHLGHLGVHVIALDPNAAISILPVDVQSVPVVTGYNDGFGAVGAAYAIGLNLGRNNLHHVLIKYEDNK